MYNTDDKLKMIKMKKDGKRNCDIARLFGVGDESDENGDGPPGPQ